MNLKESVEIMQIAAQQKLPVLLRGKHGIGKSEVVKQFAASMYMPVVERRASQMQDGDILGMPLVNAENGTTEFLPPKWYKRAMDGGVVLFFDELDRANESVGQSLFEIADSRKIAGNHVHDDTIIICCINGGTSDDYIVSSLDPAALSRWAVIDFQPTVSEWIEWANQSGVQPEVVSFITQNPASLENPTSEFEPNKVYPSRRSWTRLSKCLQALPGLENKSIVYNLTESFVGEERAASFNDFLRDRNIDFMEMLSSDEVLQKAINADIAVQMDIINQIKQSPYTHVEDGEEQTLIGDPEKVYRLYFFIDSLDPEPRLTALRNLSQKNRYDLEDHPDVPDKYVGKIFMDLANNAELVEKITQDDS